MFEKELEEYKNQPKWKGKIFMKDEEICFKDGAEFGYNKANEWHKQDTDDIYDLIDMLREKDRRIAEFEKENEELKEQCSILADCNTCYSPCKNDNVEMKKQLTKAKEIIGNLLGLLPDEVLYHDFYNRTYVAPAEQFISEVEL